ncbi:hypothetical protein [Haemophilus pittmaniae]|uniref:hypothetical protein n=1 Tax=Haemophilus pittmaniae TaxID=249188 RepID=UPI0028DD32DA|nr:hypothetical protein [Haemophilus pittmaniae]
MKKQTFCLQKSLLLSLGVLAISFSAMAGSQRVVVNGNIHNSSSGSGKAMVNIGSTVGKRIGNNSQNVAVNGNLVNRASGSGKASINIGSVVNSGGSYSQTVSVAGSIVNAASGGKSEVNIGSIVRDF